MKYRELWKLSLLNVFSAPVRSTLTVLGMAIGIGAILAVLTLGDAGQTQVRSEMARLGIDKVWLTAAENGAMLRQGDAALLEEALLVSAAEQIYLPAKVVFSHSSEEAMLIGCTEKYLKMTDVRVKKGRMLYPLEWERESRSVLIGDELAERLKTTAGEMIEIEDVPFRICGIVQSDGAFSQTDISMTVMMPVQVLGKMTGNAVHEILLDVPAHMKPQTVAAMAENVMYQQRDMPVETLTMQVQMEAADSILNVFIKVLKWVAFICILVGGIGVMNILLVSVRERRREIGVMKSMGTTRAQICQLFLLEALIYAVNGGVLGILTGLGLIHAAGRSIGLHPLVKAGECAVVFLVALTVGLIFGVLPASRASGLKPVDALRNE